MAPKHGGEASMTRSEAAREARALVAEWIWQVRATDDEGWRECYADRDAAMVGAEIDKIRERFEEAGPSLFHRLAAEARRASS